MHYLYSRLKIESDKSKLLTTSFNSSRLKDSGVHTISHYVQYIYTEYVILHTSLAFQVFVGGISICIINSNCITQVRAFCDKQLYQRVFLKYHQPTLLPRFLVQQDRAICAFTCFHWEKGLYRILRNTLEGYFCPPNNIY